MTRREFFKLVITLAVVLIMPKFTYPVKASQPDTFGQMPMTVAADPPKTKVFMPMVQR